MKKKSNFLCFVFPAHTRPPPNEEKLTKNFLRLGQNEAKKNSNFLCFHVYTCKLIGQCCVCCTCTHKRGRKNSGYTWTKQNWIVFESQLLFQIFFPIFLCFVNEAKKNWKILHRNLPNENSKKTGSKIRMLISPTNANAPLCLWCSSSH